MTEVAGSGPGELSVGLPEVLGWRTRDRPRDLDRRVVELVVTGQDWH